MMIPLITLISVLGGFAVDALAVVSAPIKTVQFQAVQVDLNGEVINVHSGEELVVVAGDEFRIKDAVFSDPRVKADYVNLIGYSKVEGNVDDRGVMIRSDRDLDRSWATDQRGSTYRIKVAYQRRHHLEISLRIVQPELRYVAMQINGATKVLRPGEVTKVKASDVFKVTEIATNVENDSKNVDYRVRKHNDQSTDKESIGTYELQFLRRGRVFARLPLQIEN